MREKKSFSANLIVSFFSHVSIYLTFPKKILTNLIERLAALRKTLNLLLTSTYILESERI